MISVSAAQKEYANKASKDLPRKESDETGKKQCMCFEFYYFIQIKNRVHFMYRKKNNL